MMSRIQILTVPYSARRVQPLECGRTTNHTIAKEQMMNRYWIPALIATTLFSASALAHDWDDEGHCEPRYRHRVERVVVQEVYAQPEVVYQAPPQVIYRDRVVYRDRPVYYEAAPSYQEPPRYYPQPQRYPNRNGDSAAAQTIGAVAGAVIGNRFGQGNGRILSTAAGAVIGSIVGGNLSGYGY